MALTKLTTALGIISALDDSPSLTAAELKAKFDEASGLIKTYINDTLTVEVDAAIPDIVDALTSDDATKALSAKQGKALKTLIPAIVDALTSEDATKALSAAQGKALKTLVDQKQAVISAGTSAPAGGSDGDLYIMY